MSFIHLLQNNLSEAAVNELLGMLSNLCTFLVRRMRKADYLLRIITY